MPNRIFYFLFLFCLIMNIHIYNLFYICTGTHACMGFVPDNKLIRIRIRIRKRTDSGAVWRTGQHYWSYISDSGCVFSFYPLPLGCGVAASETILLQPVLSRTSYFVVPMVIMSRLTQSSLL